MKPYRPFAALLALGALLALAPAAGAYTATDYYNAGLQLYNAQNYDQAIQYFSAAIQLDPNNAPALQGRANCYYAQGQYPQALDDYQRVQALQPSPQLAAMIQALQAKLGAAPAAPAQPPVPGAEAGSTGSPQAGLPPSGDAFAQGQALVQQQQYAQAIPFFQNAVQQNPSDSKSYYYLGICQVQAGDLKDAAVALGVSDRLNPNPSVEAYVSQLKARLSPDDQQWVDSQVQAGANTKPVAAGHPHRRREKSVRIFVGLSALNLSDLNTNASSFENLTRYSQNNGDPSAQYSGAVPSATVNLGLEADYPLGSDFEIGVMLGFMPAGSATDSLTDSSGFSLTDSFNIVGVNIGLNARYFLTQDDIQPWIAGGPLLVACPINYAYNLDAGGVTFGGPFSGVGFGGQAQVGVDAHLMDSFVLSLFAGYEVASVGSLTGTIANSNIPGVTSGSSVQLDVVPTGQGNFVAPVSNGVLCVPVYGYNAGSAAPPGSRPMVMDLSGPVGGLAVSYSF